MLRAFQKAYPVESRTVPCDSLAPVDGVAGVLQGLGVSKIPGAVRRVLASRYAKSSAEGRSATPRTALYRRMRSHKVERKSSVDD